MATTAYYDDKSFIEEVIGRELLENSIAWIGERMEPEAVFDEKKLSEWAENNGYEKEK